jgi:hypothetical protein
MEIMGKIGGCADNSQDRDLTPELIEIQAVYAVHKYAHGIAPAGV